MKDNTIGFSVIDSDMDVEGSLSCDGQLVIRGSIKGSVKAESVVISDSGAVAADIKVKNMVIGGKFEGDISAAEEVTILRTGSCSGKIECRNIVIESGGILNAEVNSTFTRELSPAESTLVHKNENPVKEKLRAHVSSLFQLNSAKSGK